MSGLIVPVNSACASVRPSSSSMNILHKNITHSLTFSAALFTISVFPYVLQTVTPRMIASALIGMFLPHRTHEVAEEGVELSSGVAMAETPSSNSNLRRGHHPPKKRSHHTHGPSEDEFIIVP
ncbi:hypothetical protein SDJN02_26956, partial [Cucurbita argyrosperma subsp. argyrosperma]